MVRRVSPQSALATFATLFAAACADQSSISSPLAPTAAPSLAAAKAAPSRYLVGFKTPTSGIASSVLAASGGKVVDAIPAFNIIVVDGVTNPSALLQATGVRYVENEFQVQADPLIMTTSEVGTAAEPDPTAAPFYASNVQWDIKAMHADEAWAAGYKGAGAKVCIVDTGVDSLHQELNGGKVLLRVNFVTTLGQDSVGLVNDGNGHGSHVAGEAAGRGVVVSGVAPSASVLSARVLNNAGSGSETAVINGIKWCGDQGAHAINVSIGGIRYAGNSSFTTSLIAYSDAVNYARGKGAVVVISAGNSNLQLPNPGNAQITVPAQVANAITVGATGPTSKIPQYAAPNWSPFDPTQVWTGVDTKAYYSNWGTGVDVFAPGGRGSVPYSAPYLIATVNGVPMFQGGPYDNIYGVCASTTAQTGAVVNNGGVPTTASGNCLGRLNRYISYAGTSMAAPHVTGMAAVLYAKLGGEPTPAKRDRVEACIKQATDNIGSSSIFGSGRVNVKKALDAMTAGTC